jgi:hypothetical protein
VIALNGFAMPVSELAPPLPFRRRLGRPHRGGDPHVPCGRFGYPPFFLGISYGFPSPSFKALRAWATFCFASASFFVYVGNGSHPFGFPGETGGLACRRAQILLNPCKNIRPGQPTRPCFFIPCPVG